MSSEDFFTEVSVLPKYYFGVKPSCLVSNPVRLAFDCSSIGAHLFGLDFLREEVSGGSPLKMPDGYLLADSVKPTSGELNCSLQEST